MPGLAGTVLLLSVLGHGLWRSFGDAPIAAAAGDFGVKGFSVVFPRDYWLHFELISVLLVAAVVAALAVLQVGQRKHG